MFSSLGFPSPRDVLVSAADDVAFVAYLTHWILHINDILYLLLFLEKKQNLMILFLHIFITTEVSDNLTHSPPQLYPDLFVVVKHCNQGSTWLDLI